MAGPTAAVLVPSKLTELHRSAVRTRLGCGAPSGDHAEFRMEGEPFIVGFASTHAEKLSVGDANDLLQVLGWMPQDEVSFAAMCNDPKDHRLLARLCVELAEDTGGIIDFHGALGIGPHVDGETPGKPVRVSKPEGLDGVLWATAYKTVSGSFATGHYGDAAFVRSWLADPRFHMVK